MTYKVIVCRNLCNDMIPNKGLNKDSVIHEFIHYLDFKRSGIKQPKHKNIDYYFNSAQEYNAYYQEAVRFLYDLFKNDAVLNNFKIKYTDFNGFYTCYSAML